MDRSIEPLGTLYCFPLDCYTRIKYFKECSLDLLEKAKELIEGLSPTDLEEDLQSVRNVIEKTTNCLKLQIRLLVLGSDVFKATNLVQNTTEEECVPTPLYDCKGKDFGKEFDLVLYPEQSTTVHSEALISIYNDVGHKNFLRGLISFMAEVSEKQKEPKSDVNRLPVVMKTFLSDTEYDKYSQKVCSITELPRKISLRLERRLLENLKLLEETLKCLQEQFQLFPSRAVEDMIKLIFRERRWTEGWKIEFKDENNEQKSVSCQHVQSDHTCRDCYVLERMAFVLGKCIGNTVHNNLLPPRTVEKESSILSFHKTCSELTDTICRFLFQTAHTSQVLEVEKFSNARVAQYYALKITHLCRDRVCCMSEDVECLRFQIGSILSQSLVPEFKHFSRDHLEKILKDDIRHELFDKVPSVKSCGYQLSRLQVRVKANDYAEKQMAIEYKVRTLLVDKHIDIEYLDIKPTVEMEEFVLEVGSSLHNDLGKTGSLGGFVECESQTQNPGRSTNLCALISRHLIQGGNQQTKLYWTGNGKEKEFGTCLVEGEGIYDVTAVRIHQHLRPEIKTKFKNSRGIDCECKLFEFATTCGLMGKKVHIYGSKSKPGSGIIQSDYILEKDDEEHMNKLIIIGDASQKSPFCEPGDSGAIVVCNEPDNSVLVLTMLIGKYIDGSPKYVTFRLVDAMKHLENRLSYPTVFRLCDLQQTNNDDEIYDE